MHRKIHHFSITLRPPVDQSGRKRPFVFALNQGQYCVAVCQPQDAAGNPAVDPKPLRWAADSDAVKLVPSPDGLKCEVHYVHPGTANVTVSDGTLTSTAADFSCQAGVPATLNVTVGAAQPEQPAPPAPAAAPAAQPSAT
jgi:hypothetical protein